MRRFPKAAYLLLYFLSPSHSWSILRNEQGQPRLCSVVSTTLNGLTRLGLGPCENKKITIRSESNRNILQGKFQELSISMQKSQSSWLSLDQLELQGKDLHLGYSPLLVTTVLPSLIWFAASRFIVLTRFIVLMLLLGTIWRNQQKLLVSSPSARTTTRTYEIIQQQLHRLTQFLQSIVKGSPCQLNYAITVTDTNIGNSGLIKILAKSLVQSFMANSVLPLAAAVGDTTNLLLSAESAASTTRSKSSSSSSSSTTTTNKNNNQLATAASMWNENESSSFQLSKLLSATSFDLSGGPTCSKDGHVWLPCVATLPDDQGRLDFTLRTKLMPRANVPVMMDTAGTSSSSTRRRALQNGLEFAAPECRVDVDAARNKWTKALLPSVVWLPIGSMGMVLPLILGGRGHSIQKLSTKDGRCQVFGQIQLFHDPNTDGPQGGLQKIMQQLMWKDPLPPSDSNSDANNGMPRLPSSQ
jgi:hypothetical protein